MKLQISNSIENHGRRNFKNSRTDEKALGFLTLEKYSTHEKREERESRRAKTSNDVPKE